MELTSVSCNNCGAPLQVPPAANFVTCQHCQTQLTVKRNESVAWTEQLKTIDKRTERMAEQVARMAYENELARLDREWDAERQRHLVRDKHGGAHEPSTFGAFFGGLAFCAIGLIGGTATGFWPFAVFGIVVGVAILIFGVAKADSYSKAQQRYMQSRAEVQLEDFREKLNAAPDEPDPMAELQREIGTEPASSGTSCPACGTAISQNDQRCPSCGIALQ